MNYEIKLVLKLLRQILSIHEHRQSNIKNQFTQSKNSFRPMKATRKEQHQVQQGKENDHRKLNHNKHHDELDLTLPLPKAKMHQVFMIKQIQLKEHYSVKENIEANIIAKKSVRNVYEKAPNFEDQESHLHHHVIKSTIDDKALNTKINEEGYLTHEKPSQPINLIKTNTNVFCKEYGEQILRRCQNNRLVLDNFLLNHKIDIGLRNKMLDWMIEVTSSYKFEAKTYFLAVQIMDHYFSNEKESIPVAKLHIIGVISMLMASKMDEIYPLKLKTIYEKIVHKKIDRKELIEMEAKIFEKLNFVTNYSSCYELTIFKLYKSVETILNNNNNEEEVKLRQIFECVEQLQKVIQYLSKFTMFNYSLHSQQSMNLLSDALLYASATIVSHCQQKDEQSLEKECLNDGNKDSSRDQSSSKASLATRTTSNEPLCKFLLMKLANWDQTSFTQKEDYQTIVDCSQRIIAFAKNFKLLNKNIENIYRFTHHNTITQLENYFHSFH